MKEEILFDSVTKKLLILRKIVAIYFHVSVTSRNSLKSPKKENRPIDTALALICSSLRQDQQSNVERALKLVKLGADIEIQNFLPWRFAAYMGDLNALEQLAPTDASKIPFEAILDAHSGAVEYGHNNIRQAIAKLNVGTHLIEQVTRRAATINDFSQENDLRKFDQHFTTTRQLLWLSDYYALRPLQHNSSSTLAQSFYDRAANSWEICRKIQPLIPLLPKPLRTTGES